MKMRGKQIFGVADFGADKYSELTWALNGGTVLLDGKEVRLVRFADTDAGSVMTRDVLGDAQFTFGRGYSPADFPGREVECPQDDLLVETLRGKVELFARPDAEDIA